MRYLFLNKRTISELSDVPSLSLKPKLVFTNLQSKQILIYLISNNNLLFEIDNEHQLNNYCQHKKSVNVFTIACEIYLLLILFRHLCVRLKNREILVRCRDVRYRRRAIKHCRWNEASGYILCAWRLEGRDSQSARTYARRWIRKKTYLRTLLTSKAKDRRFILHVKTLFTFNVRLLYQG